MEEVFVYADYRTSRFVEEEPESEDSSSYECYRLIVPDGYEIIPCDNKHPRTMIVINGKEYPFVDILYYAENGNFVLSCRDDDGPHEIPVQVAGRW